MARAFLIQHWLLLIFSFGKLANANSNGDLGDGSPFCFDTRVPFSIFHRQRRDDLSMSKDPIGCDPRDWNNGDPLDCTQDVIFPMNWAGIPKYSNMYSLTVKEPGKSSYIPGEWITIVLRVNRYPFKYRGLVLHASNEQSSFVGEWRLAGNDAENRLFWTPTASKECIMHAQADLKPLLTEFRYKAPPAGTGSITFHALIKIGPANTGYFFFPNGNRAHIRNAIPNGGFPGTGTDLVLTESPQQSASIWSVAATGLSCVQHCASQGLRCDQAELRSAALASPIGMESTITPISGCPLPYTPSCSSVVPARDDNGACYYSGADAIATNLCQNVMPSPSLQSSCLSRHPSATRFCPCRSNNSVQTLSFKESGLIPILRTRRHKLSDPDLLTSGIAMPVVLLAGCLAAAASSLRAFRHNGGSSLLVLMTFVGMQPVKAHNWLHSRGRAQLEASTTNPFRQRNPTDIHAQLGPGQEMAVKFATGHSRDHYFVIINGDDQDWIFQNNYQEWVRDYVNSADSIAGVVDQSSSKPRFHHCRNDQNCQNSDLYLGPVAESEADYCDHTTEPSGTLYRWRPELLEDDRYYFYNSQKYPWIVGAMRYRTIVHQPQDFDIFCTPVPQRQGKSRHTIVHWFWNGYYDAIDVHTHDTPVPQNLIYGNDTGEFEINKIDHCQFTRPAAIAVGIMDATTDVSECLSQLSVAATARTQISVQTLGLNVVPAVNPNAAIVEIRNIPLTYQTDDNTDGLRWNKDYLGLALDTSYMRHTGTESWASLDWTSFLSRSSGVREGIRCGRGRVFDSFIEALDECINEGDDCWGIAWRHQQSGEPITSLSKGRQRVRACLTLSLNEITDADWNLYRKPADLVGNPPGWTNPATWTDNNHVNFKISFQPENPRINGRPVNITLGSGWEIDVGQTYRRHATSGLNYGWKCTVQPSINQVPRVRNLRGDEVSGEVRNTIWRQRCNGEMNAWEIEVPNGVYVVTMYSGFGPNRGVGCMVENTQYFHHMFTFQDTTKSVTVEVMDGRLTITSLDHRVRDRNSEMTTPMICPDISYIKIDRLMNEFPEAWAPSSGTSKADWWQLQLDNPEQGVGIVDIELTRTIRFRTGSFPREASPMRPSCTHWWFFKGPQRCYVDERRLYNEDKTISYPDLYKDSFETPQADTTVFTQPPVPWGTFDNANQGVVVSISDVACDDQTCREEDENQCQVVTQTTSCEQTQSNLFTRLCPILVDCGGKKGQYVRIRARGSNRYMAMKKVRVYKSDTPVDTVPSDSDPIPMVCYGVEARTATTTTPERIISYDPTDPIFYSTCYIRSPVIDWIPIAESSVQSPRWNFDGHCLSCESFFENTQEPLEATPQWKLSETCVNCFNTLPVWGESNLDVQEDMTGAPTTSPNNQQDTTGAPTTSPILSCYSESLSAYKCRLDLTSDFSVFWSYNDADIAIEMRGGTSGWLALGYSPNGAMVGSDAEIGWCENGVATVRSYHLGGQSTNAIQENAGVTLRAVTCFESQDETRVSYVRSLSETSNPINALETQSVLWGIGLVDNIEQHQRRGSRRISFDGSTGGVLALLPTSQPPTPQSPPSMPPSLQPTSDPTIPPSVKDIGGQATASPTVYNVVGEGEASEGMVGGMDMETAGAVFGILAIVVIAIGIGTYFFLRHYVKKKGEDKRFAQFRRKSDDIKILRKIHADSVGSGSLDVRSP